MRIFNFSKYFNEIQVLGFFSNTDFENKDRYFLRSLQNAQGYIQKIDVNCEMIIFETSLKTHKTIVPTQCAREHVYVCTCAHMCMCGVHMCAHV